MSIFLKNKLYVGILSYNRPYEFKKSFIYLINSLNNAKILRSTTIGIFDDCSSDDNLRNIQKTILKLKIKFNLQNIFFFKNQINLGFGNNLIKATKWFLKNSKKKSFFYLHESDVFLSKSWFKYSGFFLKKNPNKIISPLHLIIMDQKRRAFRKFQRSINKSLGVKKIRMNSLKYQSKTIYNHSQFKIKSSLVCTGTRLAKYQYWSNIYKNRSKILKYKNKEDTMMSFLALYNLCYIVPGQARYSFRGGLHGSMYFHVKSYKNRINYINILIYLTLQKLIKIKNILRNYFR